MSGHHDALQLHHDLKTAVGQMLDTAVYAEGDGNAAAVGTLEKVRDAYTRFCPNVQLVGDAQVDALAKAFHDKVLRERRAHPLNHDMIVLPWEEEAENLKESWRESIRFILATGELPREGIA